MNLEMGTYKPTMPIEDDNDGFLNRDIESSQVTLTEVRDSGWNKMTDTESVEDAPTSFINEEAIYVNSTFKGERKQHPQV